MAKPILPQEVFDDWHFPKAGVDVSQGFSKQPNRPTGPEGEYARTTCLGVNVRSYEPATNRLRGGQRPGMVKYIPVPLVAGWIVQDLSLLVGQGYTSPGGGVVQTSQSGRIVTLVAVSQGNVYTTVPGGTSWVSPNNLSGESPPLNFTGLIYSAPNNQKLYFADGVNYRYYDPADNSVRTWVASAGTLPVDGAGNTPRLICTWRGRTVLSGLIGDPQNWFMSKVADPTNFDYSPLSTSPQDAIAGNNSPLGFIGDVVTALVPYSDDVLIFGGDHTIYMMQGDPMAGGQIDLVSDAIGMAWGIPWCKDPYGTVYFVSNRTGIYTLVPGQQPQRISQAIEQILQQVDTGSNAIRLLWDDRVQGLHVFITPLTAPGAAIHFFWEQRAGAWWIDVFQNVKHNPLCCCTLDGNLPGDRVPLIGSWDGYVRTFSLTATTDDSTPINSTVVIGPILTKDLDELLLKDIQGVLGQASGQVTYKVYVGATAELALASDPVATGTWSAGRNPLNYIRRAGHAIYLSLSATTPWSMESIRARIAAQGKVRRRGK